MNLGQRIKKLRTQRDWTQEELADQIGIDKRNISRYEGGHVDPRRSTLRKMAEVFEINYEEFTSPAKAISTEAPNDPELQNLILEIATLPEQDQEALKHVLKAVIQKHRVTAALAS